MANPTGPAAGKRSWTQWFEIPASDFGLAKRFYEKLFEMDVQAVSY